MSYVNKDDFLKYIGIDLDIEFQNGNYEIDEMPQVFINRIEDTAIAFLKNHYDNEDIELKINVDLETFKKGMCYQILEKLKTGESESLNKTAKIMWSNLGLLNLRRS